MAYAFNENKSKTEVYSKTESDNNYRTISDSYAKSESDNRYMRQGSTIGNSVNLKSFSGNSWAKDYTCPSDGYVYFHRDSGDLPMDVTLDVVGSNANSVHVVTAGTTNMEIYHTLFVKKGMVIKARGWASTASAKNALELLFYPIS